MERRQSSVRALGLTTLVLILTVLTLTVFAVMTLSTAWNDARQAERQARSVRDYYAAEREAVAWMATLSGQAEPAPARSFPIDEIRSLSVALRQEADGRYTVERWQITVQPIEYDTTIPVWEGP